MDIAAATMYAGYMLQGSGPYPQMISFRFEGRSALDDRDTRSSLHLGMDDSYLVWWRVWRKSLVKIPEH